jgi:hypothetical protein
VSTFGGYIARAHVLDHVPSDSAEISARGTLA